MVKAIGNPPTQSKWNCHTGSANRECYSPVRYQEAHIHLKPNEEEKEDESDVGSGIQCGHGSYWKDVFGEAWGTPEHRWTEEYTPNDFGDNSWLSDLGEREVEKSAEDDNDASLFFRIVSPAPIAERKHMVERTIPG